MLRDLATVRIRWTDHSCATFDCLSGQEGADFCCGVIDPDLEDRMSRLECSARCFGSLRRVVLLLEVAVDNHHESLGSSPVGSGDFLAPRLVNPPRLLFPARAPPTAFDPLVGRI